MYRGCPTECIPCPCCTAGPLTCKLQLPHVLLCLLRAALKSPARTNDPVGLCPYNGVAVADRRVSPL